MYAELVPGLAKTKSTPPKRPCLIGRCGHRVYIERRLALIRDQRTIQLLHTDPGFVTAKISTKSRICEITSPLTLLFFPSIDTKSRIDNSNCPINSKTRITRQLSHSNMALGPDSYMSAVFHICASFCIAVLLIPVCTIFASQPYTHTHIHKHTHTHAHTYETVCVYV